MQLQLESTGYCNAKCHFCVYASPENESTPKGHMTLENLKKAIDEAATIPLIDDVVLHGLGEPLLDPTLDEKIRYTREKMPERVRISVFTNGSLLTPLRFEQLKEAGLDELNISLNASNPKQRREIMGLKDFDKTVEHVSYAVSHADNVKIRITAVINEDKFTLKDGMLLVSMWGSWRHGGHVELVYEGNWAGDNRTIRKFDPSDGCIRALGCIYVRWNGDAVTCCFDPIGKYNTWGNIFEEGIRTVFNKPEWTEFRKAHAENRADEFDYCAKCTRI